MTDSRDEIRARVLAVLESPRGEEAPAAPTDDDKRKSTKGGAKGGATRRNGAKRGDPNDPRPTIRLEPGEIEAAVDATEVALLAAGRNLYQRAGMIVCPSVELGKTAHGEDVTIQRIVERGDYGLIEDMACAARFEHFDARAKGYVPVDPPMALAKTLRQRSGRLRFPPLVGVINAPTLRADGSILDKPGYDEITGLLFDLAGVTFPEIKRNPTKADAEAALQRFGLLLDTFPFVGKQDEAVAVSAILTACVRRTLPTSPLHGFTSPTAGSGKSKLVDIASVIAFGVRAPVLSQGATEEELEKRIAAALLAGRGLLALDNCKAPIGGDLICQLLTQTRVQIRILGRSESFDLATGIFVMVTGNNLIIAGDLTRRALLCRIDPQMERPETRAFEWDAVDVARDRRPEFVAAALTILRAYAVAGRPEPPPALGSFEAWSNTVRGALLWLGCADPVATMEEMRGADPQLSDLRAVAGQWRAQFGEARKTVAEVIRHAAEQTRNTDGQSYFVRAELRAALLAVARGGDAIDPRRLGKWLSRNKGRIVDGGAFRDRGTIQGAVVWTWDDGVGS